MPEEQTDDAASFERVTSFIKDQVTQYAQEAFQQYNNAVPQQQTQSQQDIARQQLQDTLSPFIDPKINEARLVAADTRDYVQFYNDGNIEAEDKEAVEKMFTELKNAGRALPRRDIYHYLQGKLASDKPDEFVKKTTERRQKQLDRANGSVDFGSGALERAKNDPTFSKENFSKLTSDEQAERLEGITF